MGKRVSDRRWFGMLLIVVGVFLLLAKLNLISDDYFLYFLATGFYFAYFTFGGTHHYGNIGFLIPANVLVVINLYANIEDWVIIDNLGEGMFFVFLALAFLGVYLHTRSFAGEDWGSRNWPIFPVGGLGVFGLLLILGEHIDFLMISEIFSYLVGIALVGAGCYLFFKGKQTKRSE